MGKKKKAKNLGKFWIGVKRNFEPFKIKSETFFPKLNKKWPFLYAYFGLDCKSVVVGVKYEKKIYFLN